MTQTHVRPFAAIVALLATLLTASACGGVPATSVPAPAPTQAPKPTQASASLTLAALQNAEYPTTVTASKKARLTDGRFQEPAAPGSASMISVVLITQTVAFGDLNGDGASDAAVILAASGGGSGVFMSLNAVLSDKGAPGPVAAADLGDRTQVKSVSIAGGVITVDMVRAGPSDPLCCPSQAATVKYKLQDGKLVPLG